MRVVIAAAVLAFVAAAADPATAQTTEQRVNTALARARDAGIPVALLESKIAEGRAKGVPMERIAAAVERREAALERASQALHGRPDVGPPDLAVGADALESGVSDAVLRALADTAPKERRTVAIAVLTELVQMGHAPQAALDQVRDALKRGPDALVNLPAEASAAAGGRRRGPPEGHGPDDRGGGGDGHSGPPSGVPAPGKPPQPKNPHGTPGDQGTPHKPPTSHGNPGRPGGV